MPMATPNDLQQDCEADVPATDVARFRRSGTTVPPLAAPAAAATTALDPHARALAAMARRVATALSASLSKAAARAMPHATGRLHALPLRAARSRPTSPRPAAVRPDTAPRALPSLVAPLLAWTQSAESAVTCSLGLLESGLRPDVLYANVVEPCARALVAGALDERHSDADVTVGLLRLQTLVRCIGAAGPSPSRFTPRSVVLAATPGEPHAIDAALASESFRLAGWDVIELFDADAGAIAKAVHRHDVDALVLTLARTPARDVRVDALRRTIDATRAAAQRRCVVLLCGDAINDGTVDVHALDANAACASATATPRVAARLLSD
jgi:methanogenic corrinoid protein MtbC1